MNKKEIDRMVVRLRWSQKELGDAADVILEACSVLRDAEALIDAMADELDDLMSGS
jgi:hypothetical protein